MLHQLPVTCLHHWIGAVKHAHDAAVVLYTNKLSPQRSAVHVAPIHHTTLLPLHSMPVIFRSHLSLFSVPQATWVEWTPMGRLAASPVLDACAFFMLAGGQDAAGGSGGEGALYELRLSALDVLRAVRGETHVHLGLACMQLCIDSL